MKDWLKKGKMDRKKKKLAEKEEIRRKKER